MRTTARRLTVLALSLVSVGSENDRGTYARKGAWFGDQTIDNGKDRYNIPLREVDVRTWVSGDVTLSKQTVTPPPGMPAGTYALALWMPDYYANLQSRPEYSIRFAKRGIWNQTKGYNGLFNSVTITH